MSLRIVSSRPKPVIPQADLQVIRDLDLQVARLQKLRIDKETEILGRLCAGADIETGPLKVNVHAIENGGSLTTRLVVA